MDKYSFNSYIENLIDKIEDMTYENKTLLQFTKNETKFTIMKISKKQEINNAPNTMQNSEKNNDDEMKQQNDGETNNHFEDEDSLTESETEEKQEVKRNLKRKISTQNKKSVKRRKN